MNPTNEPHNGTPWTSGNQNGTDEPCGNDGSPDGGNSTPGATSTPGSTGRPGSTGNPSSNVPGGTCAPGNTNPGGTGTPGTGTPDKSVCLNPPDSYLGLPTAPCGPDFDQVLDNKIGFFDLEDPADAQLFAPGLTPSDVNERSLVIRKGRRGLIQKRWSLKKAFKSVGIDSHMAFAPTKAMQLHR